jgi:hypothetical protein
MTRRKPATLLKRYVERHSDGWRAQYRRLAVTALKPLSRPTATMIDAAYQAVRLQACLGDQLSAEFLGES